MSFIWRFSPDSPMEDSREAYVPVKKTRESSFRAPEHLKLTSDMRKDFVRNERGEAISKDRRLVLDPRPACLVPERRKRYLTLQEQPVWK